MLHRSLSQSLGRHYLLLKPLGKNATRTLSLTKSSNREYSLLDLRYGRIGYAYIHAGKCVSNTHHYESTEMEPITSTSSQEIKKNVVGKYMELEGTVVHISSTYLTFKDKTGHVKLSIDDNRKDLMEWKNTLPLYSSVKLIAYVCPLDESDKIKKNKKSVNVFINTILSVDPPHSDTAVREEECCGKMNKNKQTADIQSHQALSHFGVHPQEFARCRTGAELQYFLQRSHTCKMVTEKMCGNEVTLFGWIAALNDSKSFTLQDGYGSVLVVSEEHRTQLDCIIEKASESSSYDGKIAPNILLRVKGVVSPRPGAMNDGPSSDNIQIIAKSLKAVKISRESVSKKNAKENDASESYRENSNTFGRGIQDGLTNGNKKERVRDFNRYTIRSHNCGEITENQIGQDVRLMGWVIFLRVRKFIIIMDKYGTVQLTVPDERKDLQDLVKDLTLESVIYVNGIVKARPENQVKENMNSGAVEVFVNHLEVINKSGKLPFYSKGSRTSQLNQLKYRHLGIRHSRVIQKNLIFRSEILHKMRRFLIEKVGFTEIETPTLFRKSPGGAQEFVVPTRVKGQFYTLVQSPQQLKQLLMVGAMDRYFQIARCYRDETSSHDRQPEFTQLDIEMSFCNREGVLKLIEDLLEFVWPEDFPLLETPFPRLTYEEVMNTYGTDKPDLRFGWEIKDLTHLFSNIDSIRYMNVENFAAHAFVASNSTELYPTIEKWIAKKLCETRILLYAFPVKDVEYFEKGLRKRFSASVSEGIQNAFLCKPGDTVLLAYGKKHDVLNALGDLRVNIAYTLNGIKQDVFDPLTLYKFLWVVDFPLFEELDGKIQSVHHPFTQPHPDDVPMLKTDPLKVRGLHYDLVLNGNELGGGSIRIHNAELQEEVLERILKLDLEPFQHLLKGLAHGAPVHGGIALGIDRFIAALRKASSISDVIAFPKSGSGRDPMSGAPCDIPQEDKTLYHIQ